MNENTTLVTTYVINKTNQFITLSLLIGGSGQTATSNARLDNTQLFTGQAADVFDFQIGKNSELNSKKLIIATTVSDTSPDHNHTELIVRLKGGVVFREYPLSKEVDAGGSAVYYCEISFFQF
jgi:hypothetical protein